MNAEARLRRLEASGRFMRPEAPPAECEHDRYEDLSDEEARELLTIVLEHGSDLPEDARRQFRSYLDYLEDKEHVR